MKTIFFILGLFFTCTMSAQEPKANFFKLIEWGEGALPKAFLHKSFNDKVIRFIPLDDGYLLEYIASSDSGFLPGGFVKPMVRFLRINFNLEEVWRLDVLGGSSVGNDVYTMHLKQDITQDDIIIDGKLYVFFAGATFFANGHSDGQVYYVIDIETGELIYTKLMINGQDGLYERKGFYRYQDSLFMFTGRKNVDAPPFYSKIHIMDRLGNIKDKIPISGTVTTYGGILKNRPKPGGFDITFKETPIGSISEEKLYTGTLDSNGNLVYVDTMDARLETVYWNKIQKQCVETYLDNGNRFMVGMMDTIVQYHETQISAIYTTFLLDSNGILIKDSLYNLTPNPIFPINQGFLQDTIYNVGNICKLSTGEVVVVGSVETFNLDEDNSLIMFVVKYDAEGEFLWRKHYNPFKIQGQFEFNRIWTSQVHEDKDGGILIGGKICYLFDTIGYPDGYKASGFLLKLDKDGCYNGDCDGGILLDAKDPLVSSGLDYKLYPNPVSDVLNIEFTESSSYELRVMTSDGKVQYAEKSVRDAKKEIETKSWPEGIYFILIKSNHKMAVKTVSVVH